VVVFVVVVALVVVPVAVDEEPPGTGSFSTWPTESWSGPERLLSCTTSWVNTAAWSA
jgi:hypothetical protein